MEHINPCHVCVVTQIHCEKSITPLNSLRKKVCPLTQPEKSIPPVNPSFPRPHEHSLST